MSSLYIHIPFCAKKCNYCDFVSFENVDEKMKYLEYLSLEMEKYRRQILETVYIGGGTPSVLSNNELEFLFENLYKNFQISNDCEITIELNPESIDLQKLKILKNYNVNRISLGIQSFSDNVLMSMGRIYRREKIFHALDLLDNVGFENISIDLISGWVNEDLSSFKRTLDEIKVVLPKHVSLYTLHVSEGTRLYEFIKLGSLPNFNEIKEAEFFEYALDFFVKNNYSHYEVSNFSTRNFECRHNINYWKNNEYTGIGLGAVGFLDGVRYKNPTNFNDYFKMVKENSYDLYRDLDEISIDARISETIFLNLRMLDQGLSWNELEQRFGKNKKIEESKIKANELISEGFLKNVDDKVVLTRKGLFFGNHVFSEFV